jgi:putative AbiEi antitoxin of type IV toxin-antitoxin system
MSGSAWPAISAALDACAGIARTADLRAFGVSDRAIRWASERGWLHQLCRGAFTSRRAWDEASPAARHLMLVRAGQLCRPQQVVTGLSAAVVLQLPVPRLPEWPTSTLARGRPPRGAVGNRGQATQRRAWLPEEDITVVDGLRVTTPTRTVVDCARVCSAPWTLAVADGAAARWSVTGDDLDAWFARTPPVPGKRRAHLSNVAESPLESLARGVVILAGLPEPEPQVWVSTAMGRFRVDLLDRDNRVVTEADGRLKYDDVRDLWAEKRREDALRETGLEVVRFVMADLSASERWLVGYRRAISRARRTALPREAT